MLFTHTHRYTHRNPDTWEFSFQRWSCGISVFDHIFSSSSSPAWHHTTPRRRRLCAVFHLLIHALQTTLTYDELPLQNNKKNCLHAIPLYAAATQTVPKRRFQYIGNNFQTWVFGRQRINSKWQSLSVTIFGDYTRTNRCRTVIMCH